MYSLLRSWVSYILNSRAIDCTGRIKRSGICVCHGNEVNDDNDKDECEWKSGCQQAIAPLEDGSRGYQREAAEIPMATSTLR
ncbi:hypothetical protein KCU95_g85, partial [Aureobasidium melanogenum]